MSGYTGKFVERITSNKRYAKVCSGGTHCRQDLDNVLTNNVSVEQHSSDIYNVSDEFRQKTQCTAETKKFKVELNEVKKDHCTVIKEEFPVEVNKQKITCQVTDGNKCWGCQQCGRVFSKKGALVCHVRVHTGEKPFLCVHCSRRFTHKSTLLYHSRIHSGEKPHQCEICSKKFRQRSNYYLHKKIHTNEKLYICEVCGKQFAQRVHLTTHSFLHTGHKPFACKVCGKTFSHTGHLNRHKVIHRDEKPYGCSVCYKKFACGEYLSRHLRMHTNSKQNPGLSDGDRRFENAPVIDKFFDSKKILLDEPKQSPQCVLKHELKTNALFADQNQPKKTRSIECDYCLKRFVNKTHLRNHIFTHTGEQPFECSSCERKFSEKGSLTRHMKVHSKTYIPVKLSKEQNQYSSQPLDGNDGFKFTIDPVVSSHLKLVSIKEHSRLLTSEVAPCISQNSEELPVSFQREETCIPVTIISDLLFVRDTSVEDSPAPGSSEKITLHFENSEEQTDERLSSEKKVRVSPDSVQVNLFLFDQHVKEESSDSESDVKKEIEVVEETVDECPFN